MNNINHLKRILDKISTWNGRAPSLITRVMRYSMTGTTTGLIDLLLLIILVEIFGMFYLTAATLAFISGHSLAYFVNTQWGFRDSTAPRKKGYYYFISFGLIGILLTISLLRFGVETLGIHYVISRIIIGMLIGIFNFSMNFFVTFQMRLGTWKQKEYLKLGKSPPK